MEVRPRPRDDTSIRHIVTSFLALLLEVDLSMQLNQKWIETAWPNLMRDRNGCKRRTWTGWPLVSNPHRLWRGCFLFDIIYR
jgi:hypothetical protein